MAKVIPSTLATILPHIQTRLVSFLSMPAERVLIVDPEEADYDSYLQQGDQIIYIWPDTESPDIPNIEGAGRWNTQATERLYVTIRTRFGVDEFTSAKSWLVDSVLGHFTKRHKIWDALVNYQVTDTDDDTGNWLLSQPIFPASGGKPKRRKKERNWGESTLAFDLKYQLSLDTTYQ